MLQQINLATEEEIQRSKEVCKELEDSGIANVKRNELLVELDRLTGKILRKINNEILEDLNNLEPLFRGNLIKRLNETYEVEVENREKIERWKWQTAIVNGEKVMFDPYTETPKYEPIPKIKAERVRSIFVCQTNRAQILKIKDLITNFWEKCKGEFKNVSIDKILDEKRRVEIAIAGIDRSIMKKANLTEAEFVDADYIKRPLRNIQATAKTDNDLFYSFNQMKQDVRV